ncbi:TetR/AcrR family transcriptional regulator [Fulvivirga sp. M361]|uniref:TetR/AcrR family transcriptional regulator n=1 Tax=Fulvivirga sp. M361 TaxID=2594266 RepID=UPI001625F801|nr:TetR/AcrR family transcriptional regulator [Fulvivirga sp. M361]
MISKDLSRKESIQRIGSNLFRKHGYTTTSMQDIASEIGIKPASLYNHIKSKHEILVHLLMQGANLFVDGMQEIKSSSLRSIEKLERLIGLHVHLSVEHTDLMALMMVEWRHLENPEREQYAALRENYEANFRNILVQAMQEGDIREIDTEIALFSILTTLQRFYSWYDKHSDLNSLDLEKHLIQCLLGGIRV